MAVMLSDGLSTEALSEYSERTKPIHFDSIVTRRQITLLVFQHTIAP